MKELNKNTNNDSMRMIVMRIMQIADENSHSNRQHNYNNKNALITYTRTNFEFHLSLTKRN